MKDALDLRSKSGIHRLITALEERGFIRRLPNRARALGNRQAAGIGRAGPCRAARPGFSPSVIEGSLGKTPPVERAPAPPPAANDSVEIPVMGRIAAGVPIEAIQSHSHTIAMPADLLGNGGPLRAGSARRFHDRAGILDGDTVVIRRSDSADSGDIVVALIDDEEATLKRLRKKGASVALEAANPAYETRIFGPGRVRIQGKLVSLFRRY